MFSMKLNIKCFHSLHFVKITHFNKKLKFIVGFIIHVDVIPKTIGQKIKINGTIPFKGLLRCCMQQCNIIN